MPTFNYASGNTANLTGGGPASMTDLQGPFTDLRTAVNGQLDEVNVPNLSAAFTKYTRLLRASGSIGPVAANTYALWPGTLTVGSQLTIGASVAATVFYLDPALYNANARTTKLNLRLTATPNAVAPGVTFTAGLYPVTTYGGAAGSGPNIAAVGTIVSGSSTPIVTPGAAATATGTSGDFNFPAAGMYHLAVITSGTTAANSITELTANLDMRQV
jgi:hypothetical protein